MIVGGEKVASKLLEGQVLEVIQALVMKAKLDEGSATPCKELARMRIVCDEALEGAVRLGIVQSAD